VTRDDVIAWLREFAATVADQRDYLSQLDAAIGDADHGANMHRGMQAVVVALPGVAEQDIGVILKRVGMTLVSTVGGASGPLYGTFFLQLGAAWTDKAELTLDDWVTGLSAAVDGVIRRGKASPGDKTMVDALRPALDAIRQAQAAGATVPEALRRAADAAEKGMVATIPLVARKGRASYLGERSAGHQDPGATSSYDLLWTAAKAAAGQV
jgi:dihydroxyacetone kinase-like protein